MSILKFIASYNEQVDTFSHWIYDDILELNKYHCGESCTFIPTAKCTLNNISFWNGSTFYSGDLHIFIDIEEYDFKMYDICSSCSNKIDELQYQDIDSYYLLLYNTQYKNNHLSKNNTINLKFNCDCEYKLLDKFKTVKPCLSDCLSRITHYQIINKQEQIPNADDINNYKNFIKINEDDYQNLIIHIERHMERHIDEYYLTNNYDTILNNFIKSTNCLYNSYEYYGFNSEIEYKSFITFH